MVSPSAVKRTGAVSARISWVLVTILPTRGISLVAFMLVPSPLAVRTSFASREVSLVPLRVTWIVPPMAGIPSLSSSKRSLSRPTSSAVIREVIFSPVTTMALTSLEPLSTEPKSICSRSVVITGAGISSAESLTLSSRIVSVLRSASSSGESSPTYSKTK